ncbi:MAG: AbrB family transcriptional regulator [Rhodospirillaceae bacterium]|nr:AbrB family transcriptional regulator [Rhodospirillaceae bacterium]MBT5459664.1 AbrB family transcriptional regulator [Rhodospirillaceae bacterium]
MISVKSVKLWIALVAASAALSLVLHAAGFPASFLIGPMLTGMAFAVRGVRLYVPRPYLLCAQAIVGCLVARALDPSILGIIADDWAAMLLVVLTTVVASTFAGWMIARTHLLPGTTAAWGCSPGAATGMVAMAEEFGADPRLVAFMQFLRVTLVVITATLVSRLIFGVTATEHVPAADAQSFADQLPDLAATLAVAAGGGLAARLLPVPSGAVFVPLIIAAVLQGMGVLTITLPPWLLVAAFSIIGWWVGLRFERETVLYALRALPVMLVGIFALILLCGLSAVMLVWLVDTDPLTAFLATIPGGLDAIAIIAVDSNADISFVLALQTVRLFVVIITGPMLAKLICRLV